MLYILNAEYKPTKKKSKGDTITLESDDSRTFQLPPGIGTHSCKSHLTGEKNTTCPATHGQIILLIDKIQLAYTCQHGTLCFQRHSFVHLSSDKWISMQTSTEPCE